MDNQYSGWCIIQLQVVSWDYEKARVSMILAIRPG